jgi:uncharacterized membrane protein YhaH (DUF805 family)
MTDWQELFLTFDGRISRSKYWLGIGVSFSLVLAGLFLLNLIPYLGMLMALCAFLVAAAICIPISVKRLHDRDKSGRWLMLFYIVPAALDGISRLSNAILPASLFALVALGTSVWTLVELGFLAGTDGSNQYGSNPLKGDGWRTA